MAPDSTHRVDSGAVYVWRDALPAATLAALELELAEAARGELQGYTRKDSSVAERIGKLLAEPCGLDVRTWASIVTYGRSRMPLGWHFDREFCGAKWKLFAYLNAPPKGGGTVFGRWSSSICVPPSPGTVVLFSVDIEHRGEIQPEGFEKRTVGVRPITLTI